MTDTHSIRDKRVINTNSRFKEIEYWPRISVPGSTVASGGEVVVTVENPIITNDTFGENMPDNFQFYDVTVPSLHLPIGTDLTNPQVLPGTVRCYKVRHVEAFDALHGFDGFYSSIHVGFYADIVSDSSDSVVVSMDISIDGQTTWEPQMNFNIEPHLQGQLFEYFIQDWGTPGIFASLPAVNDTICFRLSAQKALAFGGDPGTLTDAWTVSNMRCTQFMQLVV